MEAEYPVIVPHSSAISWTSCRISVTWLLITELLPATSWTAADKFSARKERSFVLLLECLVWARTSPVTLWMRSELFCRVKIAPWIGLTT